MLKKGKIKCQTKAADLLNDNNADLIMKDALDETSYYFENGWWIFKSTFNVELCLAFMNLPLCVIYAGLRKVYPYYFTFSVYAKERWLGRSLLDIFAEEFKAHGREFYVSSLMTDCALHQNYFISVMTTAHDTYYIHSLFRDFSDKDAYIVIYVDAFFYLLVFRKTQSKQGN